MSDAGEGEQGHAEGGEDGGGQLHPGLALEVDGPAEEGLAEGGGDAVGSDEAAGEGVAAALVADEEGEGDGAGAVGQAPTRVPARSRAACGARSMSR